MKFEILEGFFLLEKFFQACKNLQAWKNQKPSLIISSKILLNLITY
jgi:hypothetical protein